MSQTETLKSAPKPTPVEPHIKYLVRRETHSSRAIISVIVALVMILALVYLIVEAVLSMIGRQALLMRPHAMVNHVIAMGSEYERFIPATVIVAGVIIALVGIFLLLKSLLPGALRRHAINDRRMAVVVDDAVIAASVSRSLRRYLRLDVGQVTTSVQRKTITPHVTPTSGRPIAEADVQREVSNQVNSWNLRPNPLIRPDINSAGVVGR